MRIGREIALIKLWLPQCLQPPFILYLTPVLLEVTFFVLLNIWHGSTALFAIKDTDFSNLNQANANLLRDEILISHLTFRVCQLANASDSVFTSEPIVYIEVLVNIH